MRRIIISTLVLAIFAALGYYYYLGTLTQASSTPLAAVPKDAVIVSRTRDFKGLWNQLSQTNLMWQEIIKTPYFQRLDENGHVLDSLINDHPLLSEAFDGQTIWTSLHMLGAENFEFLYVLGGNVEEDELSVLLQELPVAMDPPREFEGAFIQMIRLADYPKNPLYCSAKNGVLMCSFSPVLIEDAIRQLSAPENLANNANFQRVVSTSGEYVDANIFIQYTRFNKLVANLLQPELSKDFSSFLNYADWAALDMTLKPNALVLNGFTSINDTLDSYLSCFSGQAAQDQDLLSVIPSEASIVLSFGVSNFQRFYATYQKHLATLGQLKTQKEWRSRIDEKFNLDVLAELTGSIGNEFGTCYLDHPSLAKQDRKFIVLRMANMQAAESLMSRMSSSEQRLNGKTLYTIKEVEFFSSFLGKPFSGFQKMKVLSMEPYLVVGNSEEALSTFLDYRQRNQVLASDENFIHFAENLSSESSIFLYSNFSKSREFYSEVSGKSINLVMDTYGDLMSKFEAVAIQLSSSKKGLFYQNIYCNHNPIVKKQSKSLWETALDTHLHGSPFIALNHYTGAKEVFVQDSLHRIYLIDNKGNVLWKKQLKEPIVGSIVQIDVYRNNKLQLLFFNGQQAAPH